MARSEVVSDKPDKKEFPPTLRMELGVPVVALALEIRRGIKTKYGDRDALTVVVRGDDTTERTLWWPRKLAFPALQTPFRLENPAKGEYRLLVAESQEEMSRLWQTGELPAAAAAASTGDGSRAAAILARFAGPK